MTEERIVDKDTGGEKGQKLQRFDLIPPEFEWALAEHFGRGARKYADRNWEKGYKWSLSYQALRRHLTQWFGGEDNDEETGSNHLVSVAWHALALFVFQARGLGTDDRPFTINVKDLFDEVGEDASRAFDDYARGYKAGMDTQVPRRSEADSAQPCGCDPGSNWVCEVHAGANR